MNRDTCFLSFTTFGDSLDRPALLAQIDSCQMNIIVWHDDVNGGWCVDIDGAMIADGIDSCLTAQFTAVGLVIIELASRSDPQAQALLEQVHSATALLAPEART